MNLNQLLNGNEIPSTKKITYKELVELIQKRLTQLNEHYVWNQFSYIEELRRIHIGTLPYLVFLGKKLNIEIELWNVKTSLNGTIFDVDLSQQIQKLYEDVNNIVTSTYEYRQNIYKNIVNDYFNIGLCLGTTPTQLHKYYKEEKKSVIENFRHDIQKYYIHRRYFKT
ncbi:hypothetical protein [Pontibacillus yanchengensis]|uniref:Uncharacterized protein n=1 Tax=Pontibacillus yanchengensis Y32 TaxID=1385514 RepID=A0A0A2TFM9_9BACI|nr:hypothetical protein [Pontibacillus yanchengensis]KGP74667.1 hypothetical protein N782_00230 [Pontibacillus yanchengensis Y32]